jgi:hypothetical protein
MAISSVKVADTIEWARKNAWNRRLGIGNSLEPALTSANMVMQTILGPPFMWQWNRQDVSFTCSPTAQTSSITNVAISGNVATITTANSWVVNQQVLVSGLTTVTELNGLLLTILTASATTITATVNLPNHSAADTGTLTSPTTQDYTVAVPSFSHIEHASVYDSKSPNTQAGPGAAKWWELKVQNDLAFDSSLGRPLFVSPQLEDASGNNVFRVQPAPDKVYQVSVRVQLTPPRITSLNQTWAPIPDFMQTIYTDGFMALMWWFADDARWQQANAKFTAGLLARAEGITEEQRNIFLNNWTALTGLQNIQTQQGNQARAV